MFNNASSPSLADIAAVTGNNDGIGNGNGWWILFLFLLQLIVPLPVVLQSKTRGVRTDKCISKRKSNSALTSTEKSCFSNRADLKCRCLLPKVQPTESVCVPVSAEYLCARPASRICKGAA